MSEPDVRRRVSPESGGDDRAVLDLLGDEYVQTILAATIRRHMSARELSQECNADISTIYRRIDDMEEYDLLLERTRIVEDGSHHSEYEANLDRVSVKLEDGRFEIGISVRESPEDRFTRIWEEIRRS